MMRVTENCMTVPIENGSTEISAKAYLGRQDIRELRVPAQVHQIGSWAFSHMKNLKTIWLPNRFIAFGRDVFDACKELEEIRLYGEDQSVKNENATRLLADAMVYLRAEDLCIPACGTMEWMRRYDGRLLAYLHGDEDADFDYMWFGGEEDYDDTDTNVAKYRKEKRMIKAERIYNRLLQSDFLADETRTSLYAFLRRMIPDENSAVPENRWDVRDESLEVICQRHNRDIRYIRIFTDAGCMNERNLDYIMSHTDTLSTELKAWLLGYRENKLARRDVDAEFAL